MYIKMADQMHNLQTVDVFTSEKRARKIAELENFFIPMYERMTGILTPMYLEKYENMM
jgi:(p)ppGpp synthase/HD superfamily hydrolase